ncbi:MAG: hypothetical protein HF314_00065 [Ignavibacteria bacterium]|jgi:hypothetical protein|nr:hypothetical protein [Ignavibacteria bacterium]MCU7501444.1 hypothetical protein [Ignavibacteria bacterium]MCU7516040.1 hypothetical protein [Ignavibacteria bacterium]
MDKLTINTFIAAIDDLESGQYKVLSVLKGYKDQLRQHKIYPVLTDLVELMNLLEELSNKKNRFQSIFPKKIEKIDLKNKKIIYSNEEISDAEVEKLFEFIYWAHPEITEALNEARAILDFVKQNLRVEEIGIVPIYRNEGYFFVPDNRQEQEQVYRFEMSFLPTGNVSFNVMKTNLVETLRNSERSEKEFAEFKLDLIKRHPEMPNPATFRCQTDLDFPFAETIFPVAKSILASKLAA